VYTFEREPWPRVSENAKDLIRKMLDPNPYIRLTANEVLGKLQNYSLAVQHKKTHGQLDLKLIHFHLNIIDEISFYIGSLSSMVIYRASMAQERQPGTKYFPWGGGQIKTETILSNEQIQEKGFKGML
jgi:serine/threonine protein kinase